MRRKIASLLKELRLPPAARLERKKDRMGLPGNDPGVRQALEEAVGWLERAQDNSKTRDGGVARDFSLLTGWDYSYPETTGYIVPTMFACAEALGREVLRERGKKMLDWLASIQMPSGAFQGGTIETKAAVPVAFNTGQILIGFAVGFREFASQEYGTAMRRAAEWLVATQDPDGCWRRYQSPHAAPGDNTYDTHIAWGLLEAARADPEQRYVDAALANVEWALRWQHDNGWFENCCLSDPTAPLTHTIGYALRGVIEAYRFTKQEELLCAARRTADGLLGATDREGFIHGRLRSDWRPAVSWSCLTGSAQIAICWLLLYRSTKETRYRDGAYEVNRFLRRTIHVDGDPNTRGGVKGSFPVDGDYNEYRYLNWACKFFIDSSMLEEAVRREDDDAS